jgi:hypothetical protein
MATRTMIRRVVSFGNRIVNYPPLHRSGSTRFFNPAPFRFALKIVILHRSGTDDENES